MFITSGNRRGLMLAIIGIYHRIGHQNSPLFTMYLSVGADGGGYTISVPIKMRSLSLIKQLSRCKGLFHSR